MNPCSRRCLVAVTCMAARQSTRFRVDDSLLSRASYKLLASVITGLLCWFSKRDSTSLRLFHGPRNRAQNTLVNSTNKRNCAPHVLHLQLFQSTIVVVASKPSKIRLSAAITRPPLCEDPSRRTPQPQAPKPTKVRSSRGIGETRIGTCACCRHKRMGLVASRVSATVAGACAPWIPQINPPKKIRLLNHSCSRPNLLRHSYLHEDESPLNSLRETCARDSQVKLLWHSVRVAWNLLVCRTNSGKRLVSK